MNERLYMWFNHSGVKMITWALILQCKPQRPFSLIKCRIITGPNRLWGTRVVKEAVSSFVQKQMEV